ncbi:hypothetical protein [uncultured Marinobacter sp.]|uniref:hypothetical protein n=1 Tax=uncultured Marinobacter sp. TaxID=187379 RepID=UPI002599985D|nr:hypothetical protein [uncultured Marinobacter sp.]
MSDRIKKYQCIKQVHAEPMTFGAFKTSIRRVRDMGQVDPLEPGYHVIYSKGTAEEYHSWSPKAAFEEGYLEIPENAQPVSQGRKVS